MREDTAENSGKTSHYVIDVQGGGNGWLFFQSDLCQVFGHESSGDYAAIGSSSSSGAVRSKKASMTSAGTLYPMVECGLFRL